MRTRFLTTLLAFLIGSALVLPSFAQEEQEKTEKTDKKEKKKKEKKVKEEKVFVPTEGAPGYELAVEMMAFIGMMEISSQKIRAAKSDLVGMSANNQAILDLNAKLAAADSIDDPKEKDAQVKLLEAEQDSLFAASAADLDTKKDLKDDQKQKLASIGKNLLIALAFDAGAVVVAQDLVKRAQSIPNEVASAVSANPLKAGKAKANAGYIAGAAAGPLPVAIVAIPIQAVNIAGMLVTVGKLASQNGVTLPDKSTVKATDTFE